MTDETAIASLATVRLQAKSRLLVTACCPDKDLVVLVSRVGTEDKMSLWKMQGAKKWEVDMSSQADAGAPSEVTALNWSPDGQTIVVAHHPSRISLHSLQDGREEHSLSIKHSPSPAPSTPRITGIWWFKRERKSNKSDMPDIFRRANIITGSALSIIRTQPLLDPLQDDTLPLNTTDLFAFQGTQPRQSPKTSSLPDVIASWPSLPTDPLTASIKPSPRAGDNRPGEELDEKDLTNVDSLLAAIDDAGQIHCFLDGSYPLGAITLGPGCEAKMLMKNNAESSLLVHAEFRPRSTPTPVLNNLAPMSVELPLLYAKSTRHIAESCSAARELAWYAIRVVKEMRKAWFGGDGHEGARELNANYVRGLEKRQFGFNQENAIFDLTVLLTTGKSSSALSDFNQTGDLTSERGLQKWESTVGEALLKLRDYSEKRVAPACQRLHLLLEELRGWSLLPQIYGKYEFSTGDIDSCLDLTARAIIIAAWLAATARRELYRFAEFMMFLRYETARLSTTDRETAPLPRHDILEVNEYLMSGLVVSSIDRWFIGPVPQFSPDSIVAPHTTDLRSVIDRAREYAADPSKLTWPLITQKRDLSHLDRNLDALVHALAEKCQQVFDRAAKAVARTAALSQTWHIPERTMEAAQKLQSRVADSSLSQLVRSRVVCEEKTGTLTEHLAIRLQESEHGLSNCRELLCLVRASYQHAENSRTASSVGVAVLECKTRGEGGDAMDIVPETSEGDDFHIFDMNFFDEKNLVVVYQSYAREGLETIGMVDYGDVEYSPVGSDGYVNGLWQEDIVAETIKQVREGQVACAPAPIRKRRALKLSKKGGPGGTPALAVNGRAGRRVACVLDGEGIELEMFDMEGDEEEEAGHDGEEG
ncbi:hypothetical protein M0805_004261 [Coniferiporia weirii]|nr:hypothetical protein M0805_004261 [Coniferiporia weirii]